MSATCASLTNWPNSLQWRDACCNASNLRVALAYARNVKRNTSPHGSSAAETAGRLIARLQLMRPLGATDADANSSRRSSPVMCLCVSSHLLFSMHI